MVSVLMCTYNREGYLKRAIDSVLNQTYQNLELLIIDDGSTDHTKELIEKYEDSRIQYYKLEKNRYYCYAANYGLPLCSGEFIAFMNSDDEWLPEKLEVQISYLEGHKDCGACFSTVTLIDNKGEDISEKCLDMHRLFANRYESRSEWMEFFLFHGNCLCHPSSVVRTKLLQKIGGFNLMYCQLADYDLWIRIVTETSIYVIPEPLIKFRWDIEKKNQISSCTPKHTVRSFNEQLAIRGQLIDRLTDEQFQEFFGKYFRNESSCQPLELEYEKAFLLMDCVTEAPELKVLGINKLESILHKPGAVDVLEKHFGLTLQDVYGWNQDHWYIDPVIRNEIEQDKRELEEKNWRLQEQQQKINERDKQIETYRNSNSWKCTEPLRKITGGVKRVWKRKNSKIN